MARIAIVGVGAIGGAIAGLLQMAGGHEILLCTRRPLQQLTVTMPSGLVQVAARSVTAPENAEPVEWVIVATKAYDAEGAGKWLPALCALGAPVAVLQNGVEHRERFAPYVEQARLLPVVIDCPVERGADGEVRVRGAARMRIEDAPLGRQFAGLFAGSPVIVEAVADFLTAAWQKLCLNSVGALNALTLKPSGVLRDDAVARLAVAMVAECVAVGRAEGAKLSDSLGEEIVAHYRASAPDAVNSLLADRLAGRRMETDARNGAVVRKGEVHGIPTPLNRMAVTLLGAQQPGMPRPRQAKSYNPFTVWKPFGTFSMVKIHGEGQFVQLKGQLSLDQEGRVVGKNDMRLQVRKTLENIKAALASIGGEMRDIASLTQYTTDIEEFMASGDVRKEFFSEPYPVTTTVQVVRLYHPELLIEIAATVEIPRERFKAPQTDTWPR